MATTFGKSKLLVTEILVLILVIFVIGFGVGFFSARLKYKADLLETTLMAGQQAKAVSMIEELQLIHSLNGGAIFTNGHVYLVKDDQLVLLNDAVVLKDGSKVNVDGSVVRPTKEVFKLIPGQGIDVKGNLLLVREQ